MRMKSVNFAPFLNQNPTKIATCWGEPWSVLWASWAILEPSWGVFRARLGDVLGSCFGASWKHLKAWLGASWRRSRNRSRCAKQWIFNSFGRFWRGGAMDGAMAGRYRSRPLNDHFQRPYYTTATATATAIQAAGHCHRPQATGCLPLQTGHRLFAV